MKSPFLKRARQRAFAWLAAIVLILAVAITTYVVLQIVHAIQTIIKRRQQQIAPYNGEGPDDPRMDGLRELDAVLQSGVRFPVIQDRQSNITFRAVAFASDSPIGPWTNRIVDSTYFGPVDGLSNFLTTNFSFANLIQNDAAAQTNAPWRFYNLTEVR